MPRVVPHLGAYGGAQPDGYGEQLLSHFSRVRLCATPWTAANQAPPPMGFSRQEYWSGVPSPSPVFLLRASLLGEQA